MNAVQPISPIPVNPKLAQQWIKDNEAVLIDAREPFEHAIEHIEASSLHPLSNFDAESIEAQAKGRKIIFHCQAGKRSIDAANQLASKNTQAYYLAGGIQQWKQSGHPTIRSSQAPRIDIMRQVQMTAGTLIVLGVVLGLTINIWFISLSAFVGCGLFFAGFTGWCGMAKLLARMPWNRIPSQPSDHDE